MSNFILSKENIDKCYIKWWQWIYLFFIPTKTQIEFNGTVLLYKVFRNHIYVIKIGKLTIES